MSCHVRNAGGLPSGTCRSPRSRVGSEPGRSVRGNRRLASRTDADLSPSEGPRRFDGLPRPVVLGVSLLE
jgi:hypothetical protein